MAMLLATTIFGFAPALSVVHAQPLVIFTQHDCGFCPPSVGSHDFKMGVKNKQGFTIYVQFSVFGMGTSGDNFSASSSCITVPSNTVSNNNPLTVTFTNSEIGETFTVNYLLQWDTSFCTSLNNSLSASTSFTVVP